MKILITGSSGMLGSELCEVLGKEHELVGVDLFRPKTEDQRPKTFYEASITDAGRIKEIFDTERPGLVIHAAAWTDVDGCEKDPEKACAVNVEGTRNIAEACKKEYSIVFISTDFVFDGEKDVPYTESDIGRPLGVYGKTKREAEDIIERKSDCYAIVRTSWLYGRNGKNFVDTIVAKGKTEARLRVVNDQIGSPTYAKDLAYALKDLIAGGKIFGQDIFHVSNSGGCSWYEFAFRILKDMEIRESAIEPVASIEFASPAPRPQFSVLDNGKFEKTVGRKMRPWQEALAEYLGERYGAVKGA